jgi:uncharacterized protein (DUF2147 family)
MKIWRAGFFGLALAAMLAPAFAMPKGGGAKPPGPYGTWLRPTDGTTFTFFRCGGQGLCVRVKGVRDAADAKQIGTMVFSGAEKVAENVWKGEVFNSEDGQKYMGRITWSPPDAITLEGCVLGGAICQDEHWTRTK